MGCVVGRCDGRGVGSGDGDGLVADVGRVVGRGDGWEGWAVKERPQRERTQQGIFSIDITGSPHRMPHNAMHEQKILRRSK